MKQQNLQGFFLALLFMFLLYFFTRSYYSLFLWLILGILLLLAFLKVENRIFAWLMISFFGGNFILFYTDKFIQVYSFQPYTRVIINQLLFIIPILSMCYVLKKFDKKISAYFNMLVTVRRKQLLPLIIVLVSGGLLLLYCTYEREMDVKMLCLLLLFSIIHSTLQEMIWRGIVLTQLSTMINAASSLLFTSIGFAMNTTIIGFSTTVFLVYLGMGFLLGLLTMTSKSILPAIIVHSFVLVLLFLNGWLQLPV